MKLGIDGRVALVTGASRGLGRACARALAAEGARVVISARGKQSLDEALQDLTLSGAESYSIAGDITEPDIAEELVRRCKEQFGRIDILVTNSSGPPAGRSWEVSPDDMLWALNANTLAHIRLAQAAITSMRESGWGRICMVGSRSVVEAMPGLALSNVARGALWGWAKGAAYDLRGTGVTLNVLCPGKHVTGRLGNNTGDGSSEAGDPAKFGQVVAFLCSEQASFISGDAIVVNGGGTLAL